MIFLTTTAIEIDEVLLNRCLVLTVDEGRVQTAAIHRLQRERRMLASLKAKQDKTRLVRLHQNAQRLLRPLAVVNPYAGLTPWDLGAPADKADLRHRGHPGAGRSALGGNAASRRAALGHRRQEAAHPGCRRRLTIRDTGPHSGGAPSAEAASRTAKRPLIVCEGSKTEPLYLGEILQ